MYYLVCKIAYSLFWIRLLVRYMSYKISDVPAKLTEACSNLHMSIHYFQEGYQMPYKVLRCSTPFCFLRTLGQRPIRKSNFPTALFQKKV